MAYSTYTDVRRVMGLTASETPPTDPNITSTIQEADAWIDATLPSSDMNTYVLRELSATMTAIKIATPYPYHTSEGGTMVTAYPVAEWQRRVDEIKKRYVARSKETQSSPRFDDVSDYEANPL